MQPRRNGKPSYTEYEVVETLKKKRDLKIDTDALDVQVLYGSSARGDIGIKTKGKLDFLRKMCHYRIHTTKKFV